MSTKFLTTDWMAAATSALATNEAFAATLTNADLSVQFVVSGDPEIQYYLKVAGGAASVEPGALEGADASVTSDRDTAVEISRGDLNTQMAFMTGKVKVGGNMAKLMMHLSLINAFQRAMADMDVEY